MSGNSGRIGIGIGMDKSWLTADGVLIKCLFPTCVILWNSGVHVRSVGSIEDFSGEWILFRVCNVVVHHDDDVFIRNTMVLDDLEKFGHALKRRFSTFFTI